MQFVDPLKSLYKRLFFYPKLNRFKKLIESRTESQNKLLISAKITTDRDRSIQRLNTVLTSLNLPKYITEAPYRMYSEHLVLFASLSLDPAEELKIKKILEIGTWSGTTASILSRLFPKADITTIDLKDDDPLFINSYGRENQQQRKDFIEGRNNLLNQHPKVRFLQLNSLEITRLELDKQDLLWVDGDHLYPVSACDIINSVRLCKSDGIIMCDDVISLEAGMPRKGKRYSGFFSSWETLQALDQAKITNTTYFQKRICSKSGKLVSFSRITT